MSSYKIIEKNLFLCLYLYLEKFAVLMHLKEDLMNDFIEKDYY
jgi:hypothetical protein